MNDLGLFLFAVACFTLTNIFAYLYWREWQDAKYYYNTYKYMYQQYSAMSHHANKQHDRAGRAHQFIMSLPNGWKDYAAWCKAPPIIDIPPTKAIEIATTIEEDSAAVESPAVDHADDLKERLEKAYSELKALRKGD